MTDEELMKAYQLGDEKAFTILYERYSGRVYGYLRGKLRDRPSVDDVFQATFMKLHQTRASYDAGFPFAPWLFTVCRSVLIDHARKKERQLEDPDPIAIEQAVATVIDPNGATLPNFEALPDSQRKALELRYTNDLSFDEIARRLETTQSNARQLVSRAIKKLRGGK